MNSLSYKIKQSQARQILPLSDVEQVVLQTKVAKEEEREDEQDD